jgi:hypothetical protein
MDAMNEQRNTDKRSKTKNKNHVRDLKPKKDIKGGENCTLNFSKQSIEYKP